MKVTVKTLKGGKFEVEVEESNTVSEVKGKISTIKSELPAENMKLIHSGKVLKDANSIGSCGIKPNDFLVVMVTKPKKPAAVATAAKPAEAPKTTTPKASAASSSSAPTPAATEAASSGTATTTPAPSEAPSSGPGAPSRPADTFSDEVVNNLTAMGFPEAEVKHCLRAARGNPDIAVEFLTNGIPDGVAQAAEAMSAAGIGGSSPAASGSSSSAGGQPLQALRNHPQFNDLRRLVQSNPQMLQQVLTQIGQQQPELLQEINSNQALFLEIMNEPVTDASAAPSASGSSSSSSSGAGGAGSGAGAGAMAGLPGGMGSPAQMAQMIQSMSPEELQQMAAMMGLSPDQLRQTAQMVGQMPPEQLQQFMMQAMGGEGGGMPPGMMGGGSGGGGPTVLRLSDEEMAAVDRLTEMGFDRAEAAQAFLACDKNEALAANLLMDSMSDGGFFGGGGDAGNNGNGSGGGDASGSGNANGSGSADDDMYD